MTYQNSLISINSHMPEGIVLCSRAHTPSRTAVSVDEIIGIRVIKGHFEHALRIEY